MSNEAIRNLLKQLHSTLGGATSITEKDRELLKQLSVDIQAEPGVTYVTRHTQMHRVDLIGHLDAGNPLVQERLRGLTSYLLSRGYTPITARQGALGVLEAQVMRQAGMLSFNDAWMMLLTTFIVVSPAILFLRKPRRLASPSEPEAH